MPPQGGGEGEEWRELAAAAAALQARGFADLDEELGRASCCLVLEFVPGRGLFRSPAAFEWGSSGSGMGLKTAEDLGRCLTLDMLLGNADRLPCRELGWRGNPGVFIRCLPRLPALWLLPVSLLSTSPLPAPCSLPAPAL